MINGILNHKLEIMKNIKVKAINQIHQSKVNRAVYWLEKYNFANDRRNDADGDGDEKMYRKYDRECENTFEKYEEYTSELPSREVKNIEKSELY
jgi:hypothetical protein